MSHKKILSAAIVAAFSMGVGTSAQAGKLGLTGTITGPIAIAAELFPNHGQLLPTNGVFNASLELELANGIIKSFYVTYNLSEGEFVTDPIEAQSLVVKNNDGTDKVANDVINVILANKDGSSVQFAVQAGIGSPLRKDDRLVFEGFQIHKTGLAAVGTQVQLTAELAYQEDGSEPLPDTANTLSLLTSGSGVTVNIDVGNDDKVRIDVGEDSKRFADGQFSNVTNLSAVLGRLRIAYDNSRKKGYDLNGDWDVTGDNGITGTSVLKITNGPFAASTPANVFINLDSDNCVSSTGDLPATTVTGGTATWNLTKDNIVALFDNNSKNSHDICVLVDGNNSINETIEAPQAELVLKYKHRTGGISATDNVRHIKRNGITCTVYNVTDDEATDDTSIRITNLSTQPGSLKGTLRIKNGNRIFENVNLLAGSKLAPNATTRLSSASLRELAKANNFSDRWGRGILTITSDLIKMEVFGLLRNKTIAGSPLVNMSVGATGNGCD